VGQQLASVIHLAAYYDFSGEPSPLYENLTVEGTRRLLRGLRELFDTAQFVFSSSLLVMKPAQGDQKLDEECPLQAEWDYPRSKLQAEEVIREERGEIPTVILRLAGAYDELGHSPPITQQIWRIREKKLESFLFPGDRSSGQSFVHLDDVARCLRAVVEHRHELGRDETFVIGEPDVLSYGELQDRIGEAIHGREWPTLRVPAPVAKAGAWLKEKMPGTSEQFIKPWMVDLADAHYPVDIERAAQRLAWSPRHELGSTLESMIANLKRDPRRWYEENGLPGEEMAEA
jgi:nucleoside-diphosphate-sugar epimerase